MKQHPLSSRSNEPVTEESHWVSISDLMSSLMMIFLFISVVLMREAFIERDKIKEIAVSYQETQIAIYDALVAEFSKDLQHWNAVIERDTLTISFHAPELLFAPGQNDLSVAYQQLLNSFFPRYLNILKRYEGYINEVRIEGHTSTYWNRNASPDEAYFLNMELSQGRTRTVLSYIYHQQQDEATKAWIKRNVAAVGLSSSRLRKLSDGKEDEEGSRRVSFRVITNADIKIKRILDLADEERNSTQSVQVNAQDKQDKPLGAVSP